MARETKYFTEKEITQIESMAGLGMNVEQMSHILGVSKSSFDRRQSDQDEVSDAISKGRALASFGVRKTAYQMAASGKSPVMTIFWLKVREGWKEPRDEDEYAQFRNMAFADLVALVKKTLPELEAKP